MLTYPDYVYANAQEGEVVTVTSERELSDVQKVIFGTLGVAALGFSLFGAVVVPLAAYKYLRD